MISRQQLSICVRPGRGKLCRTAALKIRKRLIIPAVHRNQNLCNALDIGIAQGNLRFFRMPPALCTFRRQLRRNLRHGILRPARIHCGIFIKLRIKIKGILTRLVRIPAVEVIPLPRRVGRLFHLTLGCPFCAVTRVVSCGTGSPHKPGFHRAASIAVKGHLMHIPGLFYSPAVRFVRVGAAVKMIGSLLFDCIIRRQDAGCRTARKLCFRD